LNSNKNNPEQPSSRTRLIEATARLLELQGYHATGLNQITQESGAPKGSLYYYFPGGKEQLVCEAIHNMGQIVVERIRGNLSQIDDPAEAIRSFLLGMAQYFQKSNFSGGVPIAAVALETSATSDLIREACDHTYTLWQNAFADKLLACGYSPERAAQLSMIILSLIEGAVTISRAKRTSESLYLIADEISNLVSK
jgi:TetR/AcrR family transcriptional repressor of lmrAB and yxaGH operons